MPSQAVKLARSSRTGIGWPGIPRRGAAEVLALQYQLEDSQWWPAETLRRHQLDQLELVLGHALGTVPFYGDRLAFLKGAKRGTLTPEVVRQIPILDRTDIQDAGDRLVSRKKFLPTMVPSATFARPVPRGARSKSRAPTLRRPSSRP